MNDHDLTPDIRDAAVFARKMGVKDANIVFLTESMHRKVCLDVGEPYLIDVRGRLVLGSFTFIVREGLDKAIVLQPHMIPSTFPDMGSVI